jgi:O-antigen ligase
MQTLFRILFALLAFAIPIEHKYDKPMRFFSKSLIPDGLILPKWFETKLYFYPSDLIAPVLILIAIFALRIPFRRLLLNGSSYFLWFVLFFAAVSVAASPLWNYPLLYFRLWQWLTGLLLFMLAANLKECSKTILGASIAMGSLQSLLAIAQYFHQGSFGLRILGEPNFSRAMSGVSSFAVPDGCRWIFDRWAGIFFEPNIVVRVMGTAAHPNVLGGFLVLTSLASLDFFESSKRKWMWAVLIFLQLFAMNLTFSRSAIFAFGLGAAVWFAMKCKHSPHLFKAAALLISSMALMGFLFQEQIAHRGGIVNYNEMVSGSDSYRTGQQKLALQMIQKYPLSGVGFQQFSLRAHEFLHTDPSQHVNGAHNIYLMMAAEMGLPALLCFLAFIVSIFRSIRCANYSPFLPSLTAMFIGFLFIGFCDFYPTLFQMGRLLFFTTAGLLVASSTDSIRHRTSIKLVQ